MIHLSTARPTSMDLINTTASTISELCFESVVSHVLLTLRLKECSMDPDMQASLIQAVSRRSGDVRDFYSSKVTLMTDELLSRLHAEIFSLQRYLPMACGSRDHHDCTNARL